jgi:TatD DNase family protein
MFIDIHTHHHRISTGTFIRNRYPEDEGQDNDDCFSLGIHPCFIKGDGLAQLELIRAWSHSKKLIAIGECGLDQGAHTPLSQQLALFNEQLSIAREIQKPVVVHCVRAWNEVFGAIRQSGLNKPVVFHGFRKQLPLAEHILKEGHYLSFGKGLDTLTVRSVIRNVPLDRIFLETDDMPCTIETIYEQACAAIGIDLNSLSLQLMKNAALVFGSAFVSI